MSASGKRHFAAAAARRLMFDDNNNDDEEHDVLGTLGQKQSTDTKQHVIDSNSNSEAGSHDSASNTVSDDELARSVVFYDLPVGSNEDYLRELLERTGSSAQYMTRIGQRSVAALFSDQKGAENARMALDNKYAGFGIRIHARMARPTEARSILHKDVKSTEAMDAPLHQDRELDVQMPFGAISTMRSFANMPPPGSFEHTGSKRFEVCVKIPDDIKKLRRINVTADAIIAYGPVFEKLLMEKEAMNEDYEFLFSTYIPEHVYYRWRVFSLLNGDSVYKWRTTPFQMFSSAAWWIPPPVPAGAEPETDNKREGTKICTYLGFLDRLRLEEAIRNIGKERKLIARITSHAINRAFAAEEIADIIIASIIQPVEKLPAEYRILRLYAIHDILHNASCGIANVWKYRQIFEMRLGAVFEHLYEVGQSFDGRLRAEKFWSQIIKVLDIWKQWIIFPEHRIQKWYDICRRTVKMEASKAEVEDKHRKQESQKSEDGASSSSKRFKTAGWKTVGAEDSRDSSENETVENVPFRSENEDEFKNDADSIDGEPIELDKLDGEPVDLDELQIQSSLDKQIAAGDNMLVDDIAEAGESLIADSVSTIECATAARQASSEIRSEEPNQDLIPGNEQDIARRLEYEEKMEIGEPRKRRRARAADLL